jgi:integrating conjugative element protein (TIGR03746 family)
MAKYVDALAESRWTNKVLVGLCAAFFLLAVFAMAGWRAAPKDLTLHIPPSLQSGAKVKVGRMEVPDPNVYTFAFYIWQQVNRWQKNGQQDYGDQIFKLQAFFTPACREQLVNDQKHRADQGELDQRTRSVMEIPGLGYTDGRVEALADDSWQVLIDAQLQETSRGVPVKDAYIRYPLHIVRYDVDRERNPWQLAVDCYTSRPERLDPKAIEIAKSKDGVIVQNSAAYTNNRPGDSGVNLSALSRSATDAPADLTRRPASNSATSPSPQATSASQAQQPVQANPALAPAVLPSATH